MQLHDLTPNRVLQIACFIVLCECFLGVHPHWGLWRFLFSVKRTCKTYAQGGINIQAKGEVSYFNLEKMDSVQGWRKKCFYIQDQPIVDQQLGLPPFDLTARVKKGHAWKNAVDDAEAAEVKALYQRVLDLKTTPRREVSGLHLIATFVKRCIQPLQF